MSDTRFRKAVIRLLRATAAGVLAVVFVLVAAFSDQLVDGSASGSIKVVALVAGGILTLVALFLLIQGDWPEATRSEPAGQ